MRAGDAAAGLGGQDVAPEPPSQRSAVVFDLGSDEDVIELSSHHCEADIVVCLWRGALGIPRWAQELTHRLSSRHTVVVLRQNPVLGANRPPGPTRSAAGLTLAIDAAVDEALARPSVRHREVAVP